MQDLIIGMLMGLLLAYVGYRKMRDFRKASRLAQERRTGPASWHGSDPASVQWLATYQTGSGGTPPPVQRRLPKTRVCHCGDELCTPCELKMVIDGQ